MSRRKAIAIGALAELFGRKLSEASVKLFIVAAKGLSDEQFERAAATIAQRSKFMPTPAELIELARTNGVSYEAKAALAFEELEQALNANKPSLMSPLVAAVARQIGGFQSLYAMPLDEFRTWKRKDFLATFTALAKENPARLTALAGSQSDIAKAMVGEMKHLPSREEIAQEEFTNRKQLQSIEN